MKKHHIKVLIIAGIISFGGMAYADYYKVNIIFGHKGTESGNFMSPEGIAVDILNNIYVVDRDNHRIQKFDSNGNFIKQIGKNCLVGNECLSWPTGVAVDSSYNVYISDTEKRIKKFDSDGNFIDEVRYDKRPLNIVVDSFNTTATFNYYKGVRMGFGRYGRRSIRQS